VYCRQPDSSAPNLNFGVDHYKPASQFPELLTDYSNLYYCCGQCNSRKNDDWPDDEEMGPFVVNPCEHVMFKHLRFDSDTGRMEPQSAYGVHTEVLLQLNGAALPQFRKQQLLIVRMCDEVIAALRADLRELQGRLRAGLIGQEAFDVERAPIDERIKLTRTLRDDVCGDAPLARLPASKLQVSLSA
jgi:hypothetical protein